MILTETVCYVELATHSPLARLDSISVKELKNTPCILVASDRQKEEERRFYHDIIGFQGDLERIEKEYLDTIELADGFIQFVEKAKTQYKLAILSNDSSRWSRYLREKFDINRYFDVISISGDLRVKKPDEHIFLLTLEKLGVNAEECIYVDDRRRNLGAANKVGMHPILFNSRNVSCEGVSVHGFDELAREILLF